MIFMFFFKGLVRYEASKRRMGFMIIIFLKKGLMGIKRAREQNGRGDFRYDFYVVFFLKIDGI